MSRVAKLGVNIPKGVEINKSKDNLINVKGKLGSLSHKLHHLVNLELSESALTFGIAQKLAKKEISDAWMQSGTARAVINNMVIGVSEGFSKTLQVVGVGYRASLSGKKLNLSLGYSHPVHMDIPEGLKVVIVSNTEFTVKGIDKCLVGQFCADIKAKRKPDAYKGKGVRYKDEHIELKATKKK